MAAVGAHTEPARAEPYEAHRDYVLAVLARRCGWLDGDDREAALHDAYVVLLEKQQRHELDLGAMRPPQVRAYLVQTAIHKALDEGKRAERKRSEPLGDGDVLPVLADPHPGPEEHAEAHEHGAWIRELIAELPERQQAVVKLRYFFDRTPAEIQDYLGITPRTYRRQIERAVATISQRYAPIREGRFCESRRSLIVAYVAGTADSDGVRLAREHLAGCHGCATWVAQLRSGTGKVAALLPVPSLPFTSGPMERTADALGAAGHAVMDGVGAARDAVADGLGAARHAIADGVGAAKNHVATVVARVDPSSAAHASGARPGAMVAAAAGCVAIAGGTATYCAVDGVPRPVQSLVGLEHADTRQPEREQPKRDEAPPPAPVVQHAPEPSTPDVAPTPAPSESNAVVAPPPAPPPPPPDEFSVEASGDGSGTSAPSAPQPSPTAPPAPPGEFDP